MPQKRFLTILSLAFILPLGLRAADSTDYAAQVAASIQAQPQQAQELVVQAAKEHPQSVYQIMQGVLISAKDADVANLAAAVIRSAPEKSQGLAQMAALQISCDRPQALAQLGVAVAQALPEGAPKLVAAMYASTMQPESRESMALLSSAMQAAPTKAQDIASYALISIRSRPDAEVLAAALQANFDSQSGSKTTKLPSAMAAPVGR